MALKFNRFENIPFKSDAIEKLLKIYGQIIVHMSQVQSDTLAITYA